MADLEEHEFAYQAGGQKHLKTFYVAAGPKEAPLLIFVHGWPAIGKTWKQQLRTFSGLGFRVVAPDMIGYGRSSAPKNHEAYSMENVNLSMVALLEHLARDEAVWIGHDWGCGAVWSFAEHYPEKCVGVCGMTVPARTLELGLEEGLVKYVNREIYPVDKFPNGQWDYQKYYELHFDEATAWFDSDPAAFLRQVYARGRPEALGKPASTSRVVTDGGRFGGLPQPDPKWRKIPIEETCLVDEELYGELVQAMERTGFFGADSWYMNHARNLKYFLDGAKHDGLLHMPVLFIEAKFDTICDTVNSRLAEPQRKYCADLTETSIDAGHWVPQEKPEEVSAALARWLVESCKHYWPGYWSRGFIKSSQA